MTGYMSFGMLRIHERFQFSNPYINLNASGITNEKIPRKNTKLQMGLCTAHNL